MGMNPVTIRGPKEANPTVQGTNGLALGRLWISSGDGDISWNKKVTALIINEQEGQEATVLGSVVLKEEDLINTLKLLFPNGELDKE